MARQLVAALLAHATTADAARDMDAIRATPGAPTLSFLGYSQGSYLGAQYIQQFPQHAGRIVLDSAIDPDRPGVTALKDHISAQRREAALHEWASRTAAHDDLLHLGATPEQVLATVQRVYRAAARCTLARTWSTTLCSPAPSPTSSSTTTTTPPVNSRPPSGVFVQAADTGSAEPTEALDAGLAGQLTGAQSAQRSASTATQCGDAPVSRDVQTYWRDVQATRPAAPLFGPVGATITPCAFWLAPIRRGALIRNGVPSARTSTGTRRPITARHLG